MADTNHILLKIEPVPHNACSLPTIRKIIIPSSPEVTIKNLKSDLSSRFQKLFETSVVIKHICDANDFVLDDDIMVGEAFSPLDVAKVECEEQSKIENPHSKSLKRKQTISENILQNSKRNRTDHAQEHIPVVETKPEVEASLEVESDALQNEEQEDKVEEHSETVKIQPVVETIVTKQTQETQLPKKPQQNALKPAKPIIQNDVSPKKEEKKLDNRQKVSFSPPKLLTVTPEIPSIRSNHVASPVSSLILSPKAASTKEETHEHNSDSDEDTMNFLLNKNSKKQNQSKMTITVQQRKSNSLINTKMPISPLFAED